MRCSYYCVCFAWVHNEYGVELASIEGNDDDEGGRADDYNASEMCRCLLEKKWREFEEMKSVQVKGKKLT